MARVRRRPLLALLALVIAVPCGCRTMRDPAGCADVGGDPGEAVVQLRAGDIPWLGAVAVHCWFVEFDPARGRWTRWEIWDTAWSGEGNWGHLRRDAFSPGFWLNARHGILREWRGDEARRLQRVLRATPERYPHRETYRYWPGPNSNTYPAWVCREAGVAVDLPGRAVGKDHFTLLGGAWTTTSRTGIQANLLTFGAAVGLTDGVELHALGTSLGVDSWPPALVTPFGRLGFPE